MPVAEHVTLRLVGGDDVGTAVVRVVEPLEGRGRDDHVRGAIVCDKQEEGIGCAGPSRDPTGEQVDPVLPVLICLSKDALPVGRRRHLLECFVPWYLIGRPRPRATEHEQLGLGRPDQIVDNVVAPE
jgi:hypothetical protein